MLIKLPKLVSNAIDINLTAKLGQFDIYTILWNEAVADNGSSFTYNGLYGDA